MRYLTEKSCRVEDRRTEQLRNEPSAVALLTCTDCGEDFLIIVAQSAASNFTPVCNLCWDKRRVLYIYGSADRREVRLDPGEDPLDVLNKTKSRTYAVLVHPKDGSELHWGKREGRWEEVTSVRGL